MFHVRIDGDQNPINSAHLVRQQPVTVRVNLNSPILVGLAPVVIFSTASLGVVVGTKTLMMYFRNVSTAGQSIALSVDAIPTISTGDILLNPGEESPLLFPVYLNINAIASAALGSLQAMCWRTA